MSMDPKDVAANLNAALAEQTERANRAEADKQAIISEFAKAGTRDEAIEKARDFIEESLPEAIITLRSLMASSDSDSVRASAAKFVVQTVIDRKLESGENNEIKDLLTKLAVNEGN